MGKRRRDSAAPRGAGRGEEGFERHYSGIYGGRWPQLREALARETSPVCLREGLIQPYYLDQASLAASQLLSPPPGSLVLDMCAAPGGKSLILALGLQGRGRLIANDRSSRRRERLHRVLDSCLSAPLRETVTVTGHDARRWGLYERDVYDAVLLDAPCSSERHLIHQPLLLSQWSPSRTRQLAMQQYAMLAAAYTACRRGGRILYSTCSISPRENQRVVERLFQKKKGGLGEIPMDSKLEMDMGGEAQTRGTLILPDRADNRGPLYVCMMEKR